MKKGQELRQYSITDAEADFFNTSANIYSLPSPDEVRGFFMSPTAMENRFILEYMGKHGGWGGGGLDLGCGDGIASVNFARLGMRMESCDVSADSVAVAARLAERENATVTFKVSAVEQLKYQDNNFDFVYLYGVLHHVADRDRAYLEIRRVLKPGGLIFAVEPLVGNPAIWAYRRLATKVRSADETPLTMDEVKRFSLYFVNCGSRPFWLLTQSLFMKYYLIDRIHPNSDRYWRRIYKETDKSLWWWKPLRTVDSILTKVPFLNRWSYCAVFYGEKPH